MEKRGQKELLTTLECLNYKKLSQQLPSCFIAMRESPFCKMFSPLFRFEQEKALRNFSKKLYIINIKQKKKERNRDEKQRLGLNKCLNQHKSSNSQAVRGRRLCRSFFFSDHCIKQIDFMLPWVCSVIDHRGRQNVVKTSVTHSACGSCATSLFLAHFDVICDQLLNRGTATWNLFVKFFFFQQYR